MIRCLFQWTRGKMRISGPGVQEPSKSVRSTCLLTPVSFPLNSNCPRHTRTWSPIRTPAVPPTSHASPSCVRRPAGSPAQSPLLHLLCEKTRCLSFRTRLKHILLRRLSLSRAPEPGRSGPSLVDALTYLAGMTAIVLITACCKIHAFTQDRSKCFGVTGPEFTPKLYSPCEHGQIT